MDEVNKTLYIPLYGKAWVSKQDIILKDPMAEKIRESQGFMLGRRSKSKWLSYTMAMRARVFDDWTEAMLKEHRDALVLHIGCGLDSRCLRVRAPYREWYDCDFPDVIFIRKKYYDDTEKYHMIALNAAEAGQVNGLPDSDTVIVILEGISMYLTNERVRGFFLALQEKYEHVHVLMDVYTVFGAKASKYKNPINEVGAAVVYGIDDIDKLLSGLRIGLKKEHSMTPAELVDELKPGERGIFRFMFAGRAYRKIYRLYELEG